jgi:hypothetical protein
MHSLFKLSTISPSISVDLQHVMQHHHQLPLPVHLPFPSKTETPDANRIGYMTEHRFDRAQSLAVDIPACHTVDFAFHPLENAGFVFVGGIQRNIDLPGRLLLFAAQAALA